MSAAACTRGRMSDILFGRLGNGHAMVALVGTNVENCKQITK